MMIVILELASTTRPQTEGRITVDVAQGIEDRLLRSRNREIEIASAHTGEVTPKVAFQLTEAGVTFTLSGTSRLVHNRLKRLMNEDIRVGARVDAGGGRELVIKSCAQFPQPTQPQAAASNAATDDTAFNQALDIGVKMMSLAMQAFP